MTDSPSGREPPIPTSWRDLPCHRCGAAPGVECECDAAPPAGGPVGRMDDEQLERFLSLALRRLAADPEGAARRARRRQLARVAGIAAGLVALGAAIGWALS